jgi:hypothetical protein
MTEDGWGKQAAWEKKATISRVTWSEGFSCTPVVPQTPTNSLIQERTGQVRHPPEVPNSR